MAGTYSPNIISFGSPFATIESMDSTSYDILQQSLGSTMYQAIRLRLYASSLNQLSQLIYAEHYDSNGNIQEASLKPVADPFQYQYSLFIELDKKRMIFDGKTKLALKLLANSFVDLDFEVIEVNASEAQNIIEGKPLDQVDNDPTFDDDFLNRGNLFENKQSSLPQGAELDADDLFSGYSNSL